MVRKCDTLVYDCVILSDEDEMWFRTRLDEENPSWESLEKVSEKVDDEVVRVLHGLVV